MLIILIGLLGLFFYAWLVVGVIEHFGSWLKSCCNQSTNSQNMNQTTHNNPSWIRTADQMPDEEEYVLIFRPAPFNDMSVAFFKGDLWSIHGAFPLAQDYVSHWTRLPAPPAPDQDGGRPLP